MPYMFTVTVPEWLRNKWPGHWTWELYDAEVTRPDRRYLAEAEYTKGNARRSVLIYGSYCTTEAGAWRSLDAAMLWAQKQLGD